METIILELINQFKIFTRLSWLEIIIMLTAMSDINLSLNRFYIHVLLMETALPQG